MSTPTLTLGFLLGLVPTALVVNATAPAPAPAAQHGPAIGECRPDIGPNGAFHIVPQGGQPGNTYKAYITVNELAVGTVEMMGSDPTEALTLSPWTTYELSVDFDAETATLDVKDAATPDPLTLTFVTNNADLSTNADQRTVLVRSTSAGDPQVFDDAGLLQVFAKNGTKMVSVFVQYNT